VGGTPDAHNQYQPKERQQGANKLLTGKKGVRIIKRLGWKKNVCPFDPGKGGRNPHEALRKAFISKLRQRRRTSGHEDPLLGWREEGEGTARKGAELCGKNKRDKKKETGENREKNRSHSPKIGGGSARREKREGVVVSSGGELGGGGMH